LAGVPALFRCRTASMAEPCTALVEWLMTGKLPDARRYRGNRFALPE
jgi:hypothetical protein